MAQATAPLFDSTTMDMFTDPALKDKVSPFLQLLWEKGSLNEKEVIGNLSMPVCDLSHYAGDEKARQTIAAMDRGEPLIYGARIQAGDLVAPEILEPRWR